MKCLSVRQPWASMIASGEKPIETRTWQTGYRGDILIVASKKPQMDGLPTGCAVCRARLVNCRPMTKADEKSACCELYAGAYAWDLDNISPVRPIKISGKLGLYDLPPEIVL